MTEGQKNNHQKSTEARPHWFRLAALKRLFKAGLTRTLLLWFLLLSLLPIIVVSTIAYVQSEQALRTDFNNVLTQHTDLQARFISNWFRCRFQDFHAQAELVFEYIQPGWITSARCSSYLDPG
ncbi:MAG: hypothetical protein KUG72_13485 [Pseudomonadales bacterium]|nr:hypothetical protein [Pseudomonadales bacterium]